ncbi:hypothetical protein HB912_12465 [Listeria aquatica]|uniref:Uncharacterized protein n=1 Tax=Listeria aquatica TaxID=1494960 RepID=A0A841ZV87_9LIST|nr:hypothetical protein [Listeria aquatica]MBC1522461.1 hypothetical protein [Listeria aquatica]
MLSFEEKRKIITRFTVLEEKPVSMKRYNYHYPASKRDKTVLVKHLHPNGNGFVYAPYLEGEEVLDKEGYVNIYEATEDKLIQLIERAITYMDSDGEAYQEGDTFVYQNDAGELLKLVFENKMWIVYAYENVEAVFKSLDQAESYLADEGFFEEQE